MKFSSIRQYNPRKLKKWGFKNLVYTRSSGFMYYFYIYDEKNNNESVNNDCDNLQQCSQVVARLTKELPGGINHNFFFNNWFSTLDLMVYLKSRNVLAVGTNRLNCLGGCSVDDNKSLKKKSGHGSMDYRMNNNSGIVMVKWVDNSVV